MKNTAILDSFRRLQHGSKLIAMFLSLCAALVSPLDAATRSSANYSISTETIDAGGVNAQSANYSLHGSAVGEFGAGSSGVTTTVNYTDKIAYVGQLSDMLEPIIAGSRMTHGGAGTFDIDLPLVGTPGIECRNSLSGNSYKIVFTFANPLTSVASVSASATGIPQPGATGNIDNTDAHRYIVNLTRVPNAQYTTISLNTVQDSDANSSSIVQTTMGVLLGDVDASKRVDSNDVFAIRQNSLLPLTNANFRDDVDTSGRIDSNDVFIARQQTLTGLP